MSAPVPWQFSTPVAKGDPAAVANEPTAEGRRLGLELARIADLEEERVRERFPHHKRRCNDCALRLGTDPNGCPETLMDLVKCLVEGVPFYCHKGLGGEDAPKRACAGWAILMGSDLPLAAMGIDWMTYDELAEAVPPAYTEHIGGYLLAEVQRRELERAA